MSGESRALNPARNRTACLRRLILFLALSALAVVAHFLPGLDTSMVERELRNSLHFIGFAAFAAVAFETLPTKTWIRVIVSLLSVATVGVISEIIQSGVGVADLDDVARDLSGAAVFVCARVLWLISSGWGALRRAVARSFSALIGLLVFVPLVYWANVYISYVRQIPTILDFESDLDRRLAVPINANVSFRQAAESENLFKGTIVEIELLRRSWSGIRIEPIVSDWSAYQYLTFRIAIVGGLGSNFDVRLSDGIHPGYRTQHLIGGDPVGPEPVRIQFPLRDAANIPGRPNLDTSNIEEIHIIGKDRRLGTIMLIDDIRLE